MHLFLRLQSVPMEATVSDNDLYFREDWTPKEEDQD